MKKSQHLLGVVVLAVALAVLAGCGSSGDSNKVSKGESSTPTAPPSTLVAPTATPSAPTSTPLPGTVTPVPDNLTAEHLRLLILAAAGTVKDVEYDVHSGGSTTAYSETKSLTLVTEDAQRLSPPLNPTDKVDILDTAVGKRYWRVNDGPWRYDPDAPAIPPSPVQRFPDWVGIVELPAGGQRAFPLSGGTGTDTTTVTDLSVSPAPSRGANRCWALMVTISAKYIVPNLPDQEMATQHILTACEPDFLVTTWTGHHVSPPDSADTVLDNYRYNTGLVLEVPTQVVEVHCPPYDSMDQQRITCIFK